MNIYLFLIVIITFSLLLFLKTIMWRPRSIIEFLLPPYVVCPPIFYHLSFVDWRRHAKDWLVQRNELTVDDWLELHDLPLPPERKGYVLARPPGCDHLSNRQWREHRESFYADVDSDNRERMTIDEWLEWHQLPPRPTTLKPVLFAHLTNKQWERCGKTWYGSSFTPDKWLETQNLPPRPESFQRSLSC